MKIVIWSAISDVGDGEHTTHQFKSKQEMIFALSLDAADCGFDSDIVVDSHGYPVEYARKVLDTEGFEVVG